MKKLIFTLDYEIHGNGDGHPMELMIAPTARLMSLMDAFGAKLVIFADVGEILQFRRYFQQEGKDDYCYLPIIRQLQEALHRGHDVQLHIHSSYFGARHQSGKWLQNWKNYNLAAMDAVEINTIVRRCRSFLEAELKPARPDYECYVFRAANWSMQPTEGLAQALISNGICIDSSVYKHGKQNGWANYDYSNAYDAAFPYRASSKDICRPDPEGKIVEFPIYCQLKPLPAFFSPVRILRMLRARKHRHARPAPRPEGGRRESGAFRKYLNLLTGKHPRKFDFNQLTARQMIRTLQSIEGRGGDDDYITLIGHSKSFVRYNEYTLKAFLQYVARNKDEYRFSTYPPKDQLPS